MANYNRIELIGNLTRDPQLSYLLSQTPVVDFGLAVNRKWKDKEGADKDEVCFVDCQAFGKSADALNKYVKKGHLIFLWGRLKFEQWTGQDGVKRSRHRVLIEGFQFLPNKERAADGEATGQAEQAERPQPPTGNDDIPF